MKEQEPHFTVLFASFFRKIASYGLSTEEYNELKDCPVGHGSLSEFVQANISIGNYEWKKNKLFNTQRRNFLDLSDKKMETLRLRAIKAGLSETEYAGKILEEVLSNQ